MYVIIPVTELARMKPVHTHVLAGLRSFANGEGICWPGLRRLAARCGLALSSTQRAVAEMLTLGYLTRERRGAGFLYRIAARFLLQRPTSGTRCPTSGTEGETKKEKESRNLEEGTSPVRRAAPPLRPAGGRNPFARQPWLRKLSAYAGERLSGSQRMFAWEVIAKAEAGGLAGEEQRALDRIDREMRACGFRPST